jgi:hypothetical protein
MQELQLGGADKESREVANASFQIVKAERRQAKARIALTGVTGGGKTLTSLLIARGLAGSMGRIIVVDTEHGTSHKYAHRRDVGEFDVLELTSFSPTDYKEALAFVGREGYDVVVVDSISHEWAGTGGSLELVDAAARASQSHNKYIAWGDVTPKHNAFVEAILALPGHVIVTMRSKMDYSQDRDEKGRTTINKVGLNPIQRDGVEYEFDIVADLNLFHVLSVNKTRYAPLDGVSVEKPGVEFGEEILKWLSEGTPVEVAPKVVARESRTPSPLPTQQVSPGDGQPTRMAQASATRPAASAGNYNRQSPPLSTVQHRKLVELWVAAINAEVMDETAANAWFEKEWQTTFKHGFDAATYEEGARMIANLLGKLRELNTATAEKVTPF